jgi:hemin uptake protein HemP
VSEQAPQAPVAARAESPVARIRSSEIFNGRRDVVIVHGGTEYRLHITKAGKLILTK